MSMADLSWLRSSSSLKFPSTIGSISGSSTASVFNGTNENLFDLLQGRLGGSSAGTSILGISSTDAASSFPSPSDPHSGNHDRDQDQNTQHHQTADVMDSGDLLKTEDERHLQSTVEQMAVGIQPTVHHHLWPMSDTSAAISPLLGGANASHHSEMLFSNLHTTTALTAPSALVLDSCPFPSLPSLKAHDPAPELQALREFMSFGSSCASLGSGVTQHSGGSLVGPVGSSMFLQLGADGSCGGSMPNSLLQLPSLPAQIPRSFVGDNSTAIGSGGKPVADLMAYRNLCSAELFGTERSPHRTQFQRENHILAERQRREEMNDKFSALRAMIPKATKKDKASIVGDTIGYVLELQKTLKHLQACKASRKGYLKLQKKKSSSSQKLASTGAAATATKATTADAEDECDRFMVDADRSPVADLDSSNVALSAGNTTNTPPADHDDDHDPNLLHFEADGSGSGTCSPDEPGVFADRDQHHHDDRPLEKKLEPQEMDMFDHDPMISCSSAQEHTSNAPVDFIELGHEHGRSFDSNTVVDRHHQHKFREKEVHGDPTPASSSGGTSACHINSEVDVQNLGEQQAVIKIVCARSWGLVLRILLALDECKVDVLQSNVTTVAEKSVHFITVQISSGLSSTAEEMTAVLLKAASSTDSRGRSGRD